MPSFLWILLIVFVVIPAVRGMSGGPGPRGWGRRWDLDGMDRADRFSSREVAELRGELADRVSEIDLLSSRVAELENRLDFTERLLTRSKELETRTPSPAGNP